jgi:multicomponent Na+:H+ antiporter subunit E
LTGLISFLVYFLGQSLKGGVQVALMALRPSLDLFPDVQIIYPRLPKGVGRVILVNTLSLLPGTLSVSLTTNSLHLHILDGRRPIEAEVRNIEARIAHMLGLKPEKL